MEREAYFAAIVAGDAARVRALVAADPELLAEVANPPYAPEKDLRCTGLHIAIYSEQPEVARVLIEAGIDLEAATAEGRRALHDSIEFGQGEVTALLEERGAHVDICCAAILGRLELVREWLERDPELVNDRSTELSPLGWASFGNRAEVARELIARGARMDDGELTCAASCGHADVARVLLDSGYDPNHADPECGVTALHAAAALRYTWDTTLFLDVLFEYAPNASLRTSDGRTALEIAEAGWRAQQAAPAESEPKAFAAVVEKLRAYATG